MPVQINSVWQLQVLCLDALGGASSRRIASLGVILLRASLARMANPHEQLGDGPVIHPF
jgi:hypothetical protein